MPRQLGHERLVGDGRTASQAPRPDVAAFRGRISMRIIHRGMAIAFASLSLAGSALAAPVENVLYSFTGGTDGGNLFAGLIADKEGALYGTTGKGGSGCPYAAFGCGTVFKLTPPAKDQSNWTETVLYSFNGSDGAYPQTSLTADKQGVLYGTRKGGGTGILINTGPFFKLTPPASGQTAWT